MLSPGDDAAGAPGRRRDAVICLVFFFLSFLVYNANLRLISAGDAYPARYLPLSILRYGSLYLDPIEEITIQNHPAPHWIRDVKGHKISLYPVVTPVLVTPLYLPSYVWLSTHGWKNEDVDRISKIMEKLVASAVTSLSVALMFLLLRRRASIGIAALLTCAYAFGTNTWVISSQGLWQHGIGELLLVICMLLITGPCSVKKALMAGVVCALVVFNRPPDALIIAGLGSYALWWAGRKAPLVLAGAVVPTLFFAGYNVVVSGKLTGAYALVTDSMFFSQSMLPGVAGMLVSPGRGLFVFTPFLLALFPGVVRAFRDRENRPLAIVVCVSILAQILVYAKTDWRCGVSWGPRYLTDVLPLLVWLIVPFIAALKRTGQTVFVMAVCVSAGIQTIGAFWYTGESDVLLKVMEIGPDQMKPMWNVRNTPFLVEFRHKRAYGDLFSNFSGGTIDTISAGGSAVTAVRAGTPLKIEGWAVLNSATPRKVAVAIVPGGNKIAGTGGTSHEARVPVAGYRPDVIQFLHISVLAGWTVELQTTGLAPGEYFVEASAQSIAGGDFHPLARRPFTVLEEDPVAAPPR